jgi:hypothetical protein
MTLGFRAVAPRILWVLLSLPVAAIAAPLGNPDDVLSVEMHGFVSQGFLYSTHQNNYLANTRRGSFEFSEMGINFTKPLTEKLRAGLQLFSRDLGAIGNYSVRADWYYLDYHWRDWLGLRAGRVKLPFGLYNDVADIDAARVSVLLPQSVYPIQNRDFLLAATGGELYGYLHLGKGGALDYRLYGGTIFLDTTNQPGSPLQTTAVNTPYLVGGRVLWETPLHGFRLGASVQALELDTTIIVAATGGRASIRLPALLWVASAEYSVNDFLAAVEYSRWHVQVRSSDVALFPSSSTNSERAYALLSYRVNSWFAPGFYYSVLFPDVSQRTGRANQQHDVAFSARFDVNAYWLIKLEAHYMNGTALLTPALNDNRPRGTLANQWALFALKTTAHF